MKRKTIYTTLMLVLSMVLMAPVVFAQTPVTIVNHSFEQPGGSGVIDDWSLIPGWDCGGTCNQWITDEDDPSSDGVWNAWSISGGDFVSQTTSHTFLSGVTYTLKYDLTGWESSSEQMRVQVRAGSTTVAVLTVAGPAWPTWGEQTIEFTADAYAGQTLVIRFKQTSGSICAGIDNFRLTYTGAADTDPPTPDPSTWSQVPAATSASSISMTATTASDPSGVEYYFECTTVGGTDSGWQSSATYEDTGLSPDTPYTYQVRTRDALGNTGSYSTAESATTLSVGNPLLEVGNYTHDLGSSLNPALVPSGSGWDGDFLESGDLIKVGSTYYWFYHAYGANFQIGVATASNPTGTWTKYSGNPVLTKSSSGNWDDGWTACPYIYEEGGTYYMFYTGGDNNWNNFDHGIATATSLTGPWTKYVDNPVVTDVQLGFQGYMCSVVKVGTTYYMYVTDAFDTQCDYGPIYVLTSDSLYGPWTLDPTPVLSPGASGAWDDGGFSEAEVIYYDGMFHLFYGGAEFLPGNDPVSCTGRVNVKESIGYAYSSDGFNFTKFSENPVIPRTNISNVNALAEIHYVIEYPYIYLVSTVRWTSNWGGRTGCPDCEDLVLNVLEITGPPDTDPPTPDPMSFATVPYSTGTSSISMTATTASDASGVEYYFECTSGGGNNSVWQDSTSYEDTGLTQSTQYCYRVKARDKSANLNETAYSSAACATTDADTSPPAPDPSTWSQVPMATGSTSITMTATTATDPAGGVEYYFDETTGGGTDSGWQSSNSYTDTGLTASTQYTYQVNTRDGLGNTGSYSTSQSATTPSDAWTQIISDDFETGWGNWIDGGADAKFYTGGTYAHQGSNAIDLEDNTATSVMTTSNLDLSAYTEVKVDFWYYPVSFDNANEDFWLQISTNGGSSFTTVEEWNLNDEFVNDNFYFDSVTITGYTLTSNTQLRFRCDASGGGDDVYIDEVVVSAYSGPADTDPPTPDPMSFATAPYSTGTSSIAMVATTASDASGVEYYFECTSGGGNNSGWQSGTTYEDTGLSAGTQYCYRVKARDKSTNQNATAYSGAQCATTDTPPPDTDPPTPNPSTWSQVPTATGSTSITMTATTATDPSGGVEYYFDETIGGGTDSGWQSSSSYTDTGLSPETEYTYRVRTRDGLGNTGSYSTSESATTDAEGFVGIISDDFESSWGNWNDGGTDCRRNANDSAYAHQGTYCVRLVDNTNTSVMTTNNLDLSGYSEVKIDFWYYPRSFDNANEDFWLQISTNGGTSFDTVEEWNLDDEFVNGNFYSDSVTITGYTLTSNTQLRFRCDASGDQDYVYIDEVVVSAYSGPADTDPPTPNPSTWSQVPTADSSSSITMTATTASDPHGVEYYFDETTGNPGGSDSGWQSSSSYTDTGLSPETQYTYQVRTRDALGNTGSYSTSESATTPADGGLPTGPLITAGNFTLDYETDAYGIVPAISQSDYQDPGYNNFDYMGNESGDVFVEDGTYYWFYHGFGDQEYQIGLRWSDSPTGPWTRWGSDPIVAMTEPWENFYVACPMIVKDGATYYMFYTASKNQDAQVSICLATASDLKGPWTKYSGNPVYIYDYDTEGNHYNGGVLLVDGEWKLYSIQFDEIQPDHGHCYMATANAPEGPWTYRTNPVISAGPAGAWDAGGFSEFEVYYWNGEYHAFYGAGDDKPDSVTWEDESIGYAWSTDGVNWTKYNDPATGGAYAESDPLIDQEDVPNAQTMGQPFGFIDYPNIYLYYTLKYATCRPELNPCEIEPGDGGPWVEDLGILQVTVTDGVPPTPDPSTWYQVPVPEGTSSIAMCATIATDPSGGIEYYFNETSGNPGGSNSGWQSSPSYTDTGLSAGTQYTYKVRTRDSLGNTGSYSSSESASTEPGGSSVTMLSPLTGWDVTDFAVSFRWERICNWNSKTTTMKYQLQCADNANFNSPVVDVEVDGPQSVEDPDLQQTFDYWTEMSYMPPFDLTPGTYYWRVRVADTAGEPWSNTVQFTVNDDHTSQPLRRQISPDSPMFTFDMFMGEPQPMAEHYQDYYNFFPSDTQDYVVLVLDREGIGGNPGEYENNFDGHIDDFMQYVGDIPIMVKTGGPDTDFQLFTDPTEIEHMLKIHPNMLGINTGETIWSYMEASCDPSLYWKRDTYILWVYKAMEVCTKYGGWFVFGEHNYDDFYMERYLEDENPGPDDFEWMDPDYIRANNIIFTPKSNTYWGYYNMDSVALGAWLAGETQHYGLWHEAWYWHTIGWSEIFDPTWQPIDQGDMMAMPINLWFQVYLRGASNGATIYHFGGESSVTEWGTYNPSTDKFDGAYSCGFWDMYGNKAKAVDNFLVPFIRGLTQHDMIPSKSEALAETKLAIVSGQLDVSGCDLLSKGQAQDYGDYATLYRNTYGIRNYVDCPANKSIDWYDLNEYESGARWEILPNTGRYYGIPVLPYPETNIGGSGTQEVDLYDLQSASAVQTTFNNAYPQRYTGDAWVTFAGDRIYMMNTRENEDVTESYDIPLGTGGISNISGTMLPHHYVMCKRGANDNSIWFQSNMESNRTGDYTDNRRTVITFTCDQQPQVTVTPSGSLVSENWNGSTNELTLTLSHGDGAVDVDVVVY